MVVKQSPKSTRTRENPVVRRAKILDEAIILLGKQGYNGLTVQGLAHQCELTKQGVLHYFPNKEAIILGVMDELQRRETEALGPKVSAILAGETPDIATVRSLLRLIVARTYEDTDLARAILILRAEAIEQSHPAHDWFASREELALELFATLTRPLVADPECLARQLNGLMVGLGLEWLRSNQAFDLLADWDRAVGILLRKSHEQHEPEN